MTLKFKNGQVFDSMNVTEQMLIRDGIPYGWLLTATLTGDITNDSIDELLTEQNIDEITYGNVMITGYHNINSTVLYYTEDSICADIQLSKGV